MISMNATVDNYVVTKSSNVFQRGTTEGWDSKEAALASNETTREIFRNRYVYNRHMSVGETQDEDVSVTAPDYFMTI